MAIYISRKERFRRITILVVCVLISSISTFLLITNLLTISEIRRRQGEEKAKIENELSPQIRKYKKAYNDFCSSLGWQIGGKGLDVEELKKYLNVWVTELGTRFGNNKYRQWGKEERGKNDLTLKDLCNELEDISKEKLEKMYTTSNEIVKIKLDEEDKIKKYAEDLKELENSINKSVGEYVEELKSLNSDRRNWMDEKEKKLLSIRQQEKVLLEEREKYKEECSILDQQIENLQKRLYWLKLEKEEGRLKKEPCGNIIKIDPEREIAFIDLKRADKVLRGTKFTVFSLEKGGVKVDRGEVTVVDVEKDWSIVSIDEIIDKERPVKEGDFIYSEFYTKGKPRNIAFAGELVGKLGKRELTRLIEEMGDKFQETVDNMTNFLVAGRGYQGDNNYLNAMSFGVRIIRERDLYEYLGITK